MDVYGFLSRLIGLVTRDEAPQYSLRDEGDNARARRDWAEAARLYRAHGEAVPDDVAAMVQLGHALKENGDLEEAAKAYALALEKTPLDDDLHLQVGHLEKLRGNLDAARESYRRSYEINGNNINARTEMQALIDAPAPVAMSVEASIAVAAPQVEATSEVPRPAAMYLAMMPRKEHEKRLNARLGQAVARISRSIQISET